MPTRVNSCDFVMELREQAVTPHLAQNQNGRRLAIDGRTTRHPGHAISQCTASASRRPSAGPRRWPACARCRIAGCPRSIGNSPWRWPLTILSDCPNCWPRRRRDRRTDHHLPFLGEFLGEFSPLITRAPPSAPCSSYRQRPHPIKLLRGKTRKPSKPPIAAEIAAQVVALTCTAPPHEATHWTGPAKAIGISLVL